VRFLIAMLNKQVGGARRGTGRYALRRSPAGPKARLVRSPSRS